MDISNIFDSNSRSSQDCLPLVEFCLLRGRGGFPNTSSFTFSFFSSSDTVLRPLLSTFNAAIFSDKFSPFSACPFLSEQFTSFTFSSNPFTLWTPDTGVSSSIGSCSFPFWSFHLGSGDCRYMVWSTAEADKLRSKWAALCDELKAMVLSGILSTSFSSLAVIV